MKIIKKIILTFIIIISITITVHAGNDSTITGSAYGSTKITLNNQKYYREYIANGSFKIKEIPAGEYTITFEHIDFNTVVLNIIIKPGEKIDLGVIEPEPKKSVIKGVIKHQGKPLKNAAINILQKNIKIETDSKGVFRIENLKHTYNKTPYEIIVNEKGYKPAIIKKDVGINRLALIEIELEKINYIVKGKTIQGSSIIKNDEIIETINGEFNINWNIDNKGITIKRNGYKNKKINIEPVYGNVINLGDIKQELQIYEKNNFMEDSWIGAYFYKENIGENYYPFLNIRINNNNFNNPEEILKRIIANYIIIQEYEIIKNIKKDNIKDVNKCEEMILKMLADKPIKTAKELTILIELKKEINDLYNKLENLRDNYIYRFYHIKLIEEKISMPETKEDKDTIKIYRDYSGLYSNRFNEIENELKTSKETTRIINNMIPLKYDELIKYRKSPLITVYEKHKDNLNKNYIKIKKAVPEIMIVDRNNILQIVKFINIFKETLIEDINIDIKNWYKWREINYEK